MRPTKAHFLRTTAQQESQDEQAELNGLQGYELMCAKLHQDKRRLKGIQSLELRADYKRKQFSEYRPWIEGALSAGSGKQDDVLMTMLIWAMDISEFDTALRLAEYALFHELSVPNFDRSLGCIVVEEFADQAKKARDLKQPFELEWLTQTQTLTLHADMPDEVRAKLYREIGELQKESELELALANFKRALELDNSVGVKGSIDRLEKQLAKNANPPDS
ncbi:hypothetical protein A4G19_08520 [Pasteurellaceae bacterium Macca]|nr:hypothetical protein [Pasteurellaceae bacterium Macca]